MRTRTARCHGTRQLGAKVRAVSPAEVAFLVGTPEHRFPATASATRNCHARLERSGSFSEPPARVPAPDRISPAHRPMPGRQLRMQLTPACWIPTASDSSWRVAFAWSGLATVRNKVEIESSCGPSTSHDGPHHARSGHLELANGYRSRARASIRMQSFKDWSVPLLDATRQVWSKSAANSKTPQTSRLSAATKYSWSHRNGSTFIVLSNPVAQELRQTWQGKKTKFRRIGGQSSSPSGVAIQTDQASSSVEANFLDFGNFQISETFSFPTTISFDEQPVRASIEDSPTELFCRGLGTA